MSEEVVDYSQYSDDELIKMYHHEKHEANVFDVSQLVKKILLNSLYGALGNQYFFLYKTELARSITLLGQCMVNKAAKSENEYVSKVLNEKEVKDRRAYGDTDSVTGDSRITVKKNSENDKYNKITIENFYNEVSSNEIETVTGKFVKNVSGFKTLTIENNNIVETDIKYVMRHKTRKHLYKIKLKDTYVTVTEDHSIMFLHNDVLTKGTVKDIKKGDKIIEIIE